MNDDFTRYEVMRDGGATPEQVYNAARKDGIDSITRIRLVRAVYSLSPREAKDVLLRADNTATSSSEFQGQIADRLGL